MPPSPFQASSPSERYARYAQAVKEERLPLALVDLDALDRNIEILLPDARRLGKHLRLASKSVRCPALIHYIFDNGGGTVRGIMSYTVEEGAFLIEKGFDDVLVAYPSVQPSDARLLAEVNRGPATLAIVVDSEDHLERLDSAGQAAGSRIPVVVEADMSWRPLGGRLHLGVRRSPLRTPEAVAGLAARAAARRGIAFHGVMGYEAQIAGMGDANPFTKALNPIKRFIRLRSRPHVEATRRQIAEILASRGIPPVVFNGGGTGSLNWCTRESALTEVTAGSGFLASHLFDYYRDFTLEPAAFFALQVARRSDRGYVTCHGGGYVASGEAGPDRLPRPWFPEGLRLVGVEGTGEVQTPLLVPPGVDLDLGDPVFFRHTKAGELAEHFTEYLLLRGDRVVDRVPTYRGLGRAFL
jgi:D-serine deaminase-like pyridoxal phosphate-dependent protein